MTNFPPPPLGDEPQRPAGAPQPWPSGPGPGGSASSGWASPPSAPPGWGPGAPPPSRSGLAVAALVLGIVGIFTFFIVITPLLAFIFGLVSASQIKRSHGRTSGLGLARAGWILGAIGLALAATIITLVATGVIDVDETPIDELDRGDCVESDLDEQDPGESVEVRSLPVVECDEPHDAEVFRVAELNPDEDREYPSEAELAAEAIRTCQESLADAAGSQASELTIGFIASDEDSWDELRGLVVCLAFDADGDDLTASIGD